MARFPSFMALPGPQELRTRLKTDPTPSGFGRQALCCLKLGDAVAPKDCTGPVVENRCCAPEKKKDPALPSGLHGAKVGLYYKYELDCSILAVSGGVWGRVQAANKNREPSFVRSCGERTSS